MCAAVMGVLIFSGSCAYAQSVTFRQAVELALQHSGLMAMASADEIRAREGYLEARDMFLPQLTVGSGLAWTYGFPLSIEGSAPSIVNVNAQNYLFNPAQHEFVRAAHRSWDAASYLSQDRKNQVILETAADYAELDMFTSTLNILHQQQSAAAEAERITNERVQAGVDSQLEMTRAKLEAAKVEMKIAESQGDADVLRTRLSQLTGLPLDSIHTVSESIPRLPEISQGDDLINEAVNSSPLVKQADQQARAKEFSAKGEHKMNYPAVDFVAQYGLFSKANNFQDFFTRFQRNNATVGVAIRFPFLNYSQRAHAEAADEEALVARKQADAVKDQVTSDTLKLQRSLRQLQAAKEVARLEHEIAEADVESAHVRVQAGQTSPKDEDLARVKEQESYVSFLEASDSLDKAEMQLLKSTDQIQNWALGNPQR